ncbi:MAG: C39 family peptidase [Nocardioides sp.]
MSRFTQTMTRLQPRHRAVMVAFAALLLLVTTALLVPSGDDRDEGALAPLTGPTYAARDSAPGPGVVSAADRAEIDRVLATAPDRVSARLSATELAERLVRCAEFEEQRYCLGVGWTTADPELVRARATAAPHAASRSIFVETTGDLETSDLLAQRAALPAPERLAAERAELEAAARGVAKVVLLRHQVLGEPVPDGFLERHPEARATTDSNATAARGTPKTRADYPRRSTVLSTKRTRAQNTTYWCGPATMQMIAWGWQKERKRQGHWADKLGTTTSGSAISEMVRVINGSTGWDREEYAGDYVVLDISNWSYKKWLLLQMRHIEDYRAPVVLHPILLRTFYPYLDDDASGHFQVGRGYDKRGSKPAHLGYFEPWDQQRFDPSEPSIARVQWRSAYQSFRANQAHPHQNIGV